MSLCKPWIHTVNDFFDSPYFPPTLQICPLLIFSNSLNKTTIPKAVQKNERIILDISLSSGAFPSPSAIIAGSTLDISKSTTYCHYLLLSSPSHHNHSQRVPTRSLLLLLFFVSQIFLNASHHIMSLLKIL